MGNQRNGGRSNNNEVSNTSHITNTADPDWLRKLDENRKYNLIFFGIHDTDKIDEDARVVEEVLCTVGQNSLIEDIKIFELFAVLVP